MSPRHIVQNSNINVKFNYNCEPSPGILKPRGDKGKMKEDINILCLMLL